MSVNLSLIAGAGWQFFNNNGVPLSGGLIYTYQAGTTTPQATYTTISGLIAHPNPIVLDSAGRVPTGEIWLTQGQSYKFVVKDSAAVTIGTYDNIDGANDPTSLLALLANTSDPTKGDALIGFRQSNASGNLTGSVGRTVHQKLQEVVSVKDFGAVGDWNGVTGADDTAAIQAAVNQLEYGQALYFPPGTYQITDEITIPAGVSMSFYGAGSRASIIKQTTSGKSGLVSGNNPPTTSTNWFQMRDMALIGNNSDAWGFDMNGLSRANYINVVFEAWGYTSKTKGCVRIRASLIVVFTNCAFNASNRGIYNEETLVTMWNGGGCFGCSFEALYGPAIESNYLSGLSFVGNTIEACYSGGVRINTGGGGLIFHGNYFEENTTAGGAGIYYDIYIGSGSYIKGVDIRGNYFNGKITGATEDYVPIRVKYAYALTIDANDLNASPIGQLLKCDSGANIAQVYLGSVAFNTGAYSPTNTYANLPTDFYFNNNNTNIYNQIINYQPTLVRSVAVPVSSNVFTTSTAGTGGVYAQGIGTYLDTGLTASSTALASTTSMALGISEGQSYINWAKSLVLDFYISNINTGTTNGKSWAMLSKVVANGDPTDNAVGFRIDGNALKGIVCNSFGTPVVVDLATTISPTVVHLLRVVGNGGSNWDWYYDGTLVGTTYLVLSGQVAANLTLSVANNADVFQQRIGIFGCNIRTNQS